MSRLWRWWVERCDREVDLRPIALVRILTSLCLILDLSRVAQLGLIDDFYRPYALGGLNRSPDTAYILDQLLPAATAGYWAYGVVLVCMALAMLGVGARPALIIGVLFSAQLGHLHPGGDRAVDRILRFTLLMLAFTDAHRCWSLAPGPRQTHGKGWPMDMVRFVLVLVYLSAGIGKPLTEPDWFATSGTPVLYRIFTDPMAAHMDPYTWLNYQWLLRIAGWGTVIFESAGFLILTRFAPYWALIGVTMHLGIFYTMDLGMFSWGILSLYPLLFAPWIEKIGKR